MRDTLPLAEKTLVMKIIPSMMSLAGEAEAGRS
jgi:hypothetical protein